ncbi:unnamed protein product [Amoebophrya sp. A25]|nr:unnamed protein product [Amoebophrya sp. A25]|eukprot:GSA25T00021834001.1
MSMKMQHVVMLSKGGQPSAVTKSLCGRTQRAHLSTTVTQRAHLSSTTVGGLCGRTQRARCSTTTVIGRTTAVRRLDRYQYGGSSSSSTTNALSSLHFVVHPGAGEQFCRSIHSLRRSTCVQRRGIAGKVEVTGGPQATYDALLDGGKINRDENQVEVVKHLEALSNLIKDYEPRDSPGAASAAPAAASTQAASGGGFFASLFGGAATTPNPPATTAAPRAPPPAATPELKFDHPRGLYIYGGCGSGKSFLMDLFYDTQTHIERKRRVHFHEWLIEVHDRLHKKTHGKGHAKADSVWSATAAREQRESLQAGSSDKDKKSDIMESIADDMILEAWLFCFDEFQVTHISDAMIMKQLFSILFRKGAVVVSTSNRPPEDLYLNGLNRPLFLPFIPLLKERCEVVDIASQTDYRLVTDYAEDAFQVFFSPIDDKQRAFFDNKFKRFTAGNVVQDDVIEVQGRKFNIPARGSKVKVAKFDFRDLCDKPLGAADYISIAKSFHTLFIDNVPALSLQERDQVRRLITLIDNLYEQRTKCVLLSETRAAEIFSVDPSVDKKTAIQDEIFAWDRTVSRLTEMSSIEYLRERAQSLPPMEFWAQLSIIQKFQANGTSGPGGTRGGFRRTKSQLTTIQDPESSKYADEEIDEIWSRFDVDLSGELDRDELSTVVHEIRTFHGSANDITSDEFDMVWRAFDTDESGTVDKDEFRAYVKKYTLERMPPFQISPAGSSPELIVKMDRKGSTRGS